MNHDLKKGSRKTFISPQCLTREILNYKSKYVTPHTPRPHLMLASGSLAKSFLKKCLLMSLLCTGHCSRGWDIAVNRMDKNTCPDSVNIPYGGNIVNKKTVQ